MQLGETFFCFRELCQQLLFLLFYTEKNITDLLLKNPSELKINLRIFFTLILCKRKGRGKGDKSLVKPFKFCMFVLFSGGGKRGGCGSKGFPFHCRRRAQGCGGLVLLKVVGGFSKFY